ncbi:Hint domain-containing protein [Rhodobacteraceae bacterium B1Z28]|uniref:Hint domain-containing protein n=2 Tax=Ruegeria haliotis TaxID=2747601 RepID=A0ABX2PLT5_9RHOB|nr:Hint domain-containing protein [Ruegeria haliotis]
MQVSNVTPTNAPDTTDPGAIVDVPCFTAGTWVLTPSGQKPIENLSAGDEVITADHGPQRIRWIGARRLERNELEAKPQLRPIRIKAGALGSALPERDLLVSPQHRMLVHSPIAVRMFDAAEVLVPAHMLIDVPGIAMEDATESLTYYHVLFDRHEIIFAEGAPSESLFTGPQAISSLPPAARAEIFELFPSLERPDHAPDSARQIPARGRQIRNMIDRHIKNDRPLINR